MFICIAVLTSYGLLLCFANIRYLPLQRKFRPLRDPNPANDSGHVSLNDNKARSRDDMREAMDFAAMMEGRDVKGTGLEDMLAPMSPNAMAPPDIKSNPPLALAPS